MQYLFPQLNYPKKLLSLLLSFLAVIVLLNFLVAILTITITLMHTDSLAESFAEPLPQRINFQHLLDNKDIALGEEQAFLQGNQGFMWIGISSRT